MQNTDYIVSRVNAEDSIEVLAIDSAFAACENVIQEQSEDEDDLIVITKVSDANDELIEAARRFEFSIDRATPALQSHGNHRDGSAPFVAYSGLINGRRFNVDVDQLSAPRFDITLTDDERDTILNAIENGAR